MLQKEGTIFCAKAQRCGVLPGRVTREPRASSQKMSNVHEQEAVIQPPLLRWDVEEQSPTMAMPHPGLSPRQ